MANGRWPMADNGLGIDPGGQAMLVRFVGGPRDGLVMQIRDGIGEFNFAVPTRDLRAVDPLPLDLLVADDVLFEMVVYRRTRWTRRQWHEPPGEPRPDPTVAELLAALDFDPDNQGLRLVAADALEEAGRDVEAATLRSGLPWIISETWRGPRGPRVWTPGPPCVLFVVEGYDRSLIGDEEIDAAAKWLAVRAAQGLATRATAVHGHLDYLTPQFAAEYRAQLRRTRDAGTDPAGVIGYQLATLDDGRFMVRVVPGRALGYRDDQHEPLWRWPVEPEPIARWPEAVRADVF